MQRKYQKLNRSKQKYNQCQCPKDKISVRHAYRR